MFRGSGLSKHSKNVEQILKGLKFWLQCVCFTVEKRLEYSNQMIPFVWFSKPEFITLTVVFIALRKNASTSPSVQN